MCGVRCAVHALVLRARCILAALGVDGRGRSLAEQAAARAAQEQEAKLVEAEVMQRLAALGVDEATLHHSAHSADRSPTDRSPTRASPAAPPREPRPAAKGPAPRPSPATWLACGCAGRRSSRRPPTSGGGAPQQSAAPPRAPATPHRPAPDPEKFCWVPREAAAPRPRAARTLVVFDFDCTLSTLHLFEALRSRAGQAARAHDPHAFYQR